MDFSAMASGIAVGAGFGFVLQRGRFCLNTAFRNLFYIKDFTLVRTYFLALVVSLLGTNLLEFFNVLHLHPAQQAFAWPANSLGGYLFGIGMVLAGGSASGTWYKTGEGLTGSWMAAFGLMLGAAAAEEGILAGATASLRGLVAAGGERLTIHDALGVNRWIVIAAVSITALSFVFSKREQFIPAQVGFHWRTTGILTGLIAVLGLFLSEVTTGAATGLTFPLPSSALLGSLVSGRPGEWGAWMVIGVPLGSFMSARNIHEFSLRAPRADTMLQQFLGGAIMGAGGVLAGGCGIGHGLTGLAALSLASLVSMIFIILGSWTMVYVLFMRNPSGR